jgi:hypothetical protein
MAWFRILQTLSCNARSSAVRALIRLVLPFRDPRFRQNGLAYHTIAAVISPTLYGMFPENFSAAAANSIALSISLTDMNTRLNCRSMCGPMFWSGAIWQMPGRNGGAYIKSSMTLARLCPFFSILLIVSESGFPSPSRLSTAKTLFSL